MLGVMMPQLALKRKYIHFVNLSNEMVLQIERIVALLFNGVVDCEYPKGLMRGVPHQSDGLLELAHLAVDAGTAGLLDMAVYRNVGLLLAFLLVLVDARVEIRQVFDYRHVCVDHLHQYDVAILGEEFL